MKKSFLLPDDAWASPSFDDGGGAVMHSPAANNDGLIFDDGEPFALAGASVVTTVSTNAAKPVAAISTPADYLVNGFWQYNNALSHHWASNTITYNINGLNAAEQFLAQSALQAWHEVANVTFVQTTGAANITFSDAGTMQAVTSAGWYSNGAMASATVDISQDWITNDGGAMDGKTGIDSYGYQTYIHEIGHALGLGHQGPYNGSASYSTNALYADDTWQYSIMSYFAENNYSGSTYRYVVTPQMADIYAVGTMYGAATATRTGDTIYGFNSNAGAVFSFSNYTSAPALTIYDSGGNDTLDCSGYSVAQTIDLHPGAFSSVGGLVHNIGIALNATIENAIGGGGNDTLIAGDGGCALYGGGGNDALTGGAGNDKLIGGTGVDTMTGGGGADTFVFVIGDSSAASGQHDRITDFVSGADHIDLSGIDAISGTGGVDAFHFIANAIFSGVAGELDYFYNSTLGVTVLQGDTNGDRAADFAIDLTGNIAFTLNDLIGAYALPVVLESAGATTLTQLGSGFFLYAHGTSTGPSLKYGGAAALAGQFGGWTPIGVEAVSGGYQVAWKTTGADQYTLWNADSSGNFVSNPIGTVSGGSATLTSLETSFNQDLNGDGTIGAASVAAVVLESFGSTSLQMLANNYNLIDIASGTGPSLKYGGATAIAGQFGGWTPIGVEAVSGGYQLAWKMTGADQYTFWNADSSGNFVSNAIGTVSGGSATLASFETSFSQDLNGDGTIGAAAIPGVVIESLGATSLQLQANIYYLVDIGSGAGPSLKYGGAAAVVSQFGGWTPIGVEAVSGGYQLAWKMAGADQYTFWNIDGSGNFVSNTVGTLSGSSATLTSLETSFHQDLNGDGTIGAAGSSAVVLESSGSTSLQLLANNYNLINIGSGAGPSLKYGGAAAVPGQFGGWTPIGVEAASGGYQVAWKMAGADQYTFWNADGNGNFVSNTVGTVSGNSATLASLETSFHQDLNGDGTIGVHQAPLSPAQQSSAPLMSLRDDGAFVFKAGFGGGEPASAAQNQFLAPDDEKSMSKHDGPTAQSVPEIHDTMDLAIAHLLHQNDFIIR
jgi:serralysin